MRNKKEKRFYDDYPLWVLWIMVLAMQFTVGWIVIYLLVG